MSEFNGGESSSSGTRVKLIPGPAGPQGPTGPQGPQGDPGPTGSAGYNHTQSTPSSTWTINHNLGYKPSVDIFTVGGVEMMGEVVHTSDNQVIIGFNTALAGFARLI